MENPAPNSTGPSTKEYFDKKQDRAEIKHLILKKYLEAWFPIMSQGKFAKKKIVFVDGFAGTGEFEDGKDGSPLIALKTIIEHKSKHKFISKIEFICIEKVKENADKLKTAIDNFCKDLKDNLLKDLNNLITVTIVTDEFEKALPRILEDPKYKAFPMLVFADPFGYSQMSMELLNKVLSRKKTEVFVNVMDGFANRFLKVESQKDAITRLIGSDAWIDATKDIEDPKKKLRKFINCYTDNMNMNKDTYTLKFAMINGQNRHTYHLVFGSKHIKGFKAMKRAMASASQAKECYFYSEFCKMTLSKIDTKTNEYKSHCAEETYKLLLDKYKQNKHPVSGADIDEFIWVDTPYISNFKDKLRERLQNAHDRGTIELTQNKKFENIMVKFCIEQTSRSLEPVIEDQCEKTPRKLLKNNNQQLPVKRSSDIVPLAVTKDVKKRLRFES